jgi:hypothetical protein
MVMVALLGHLVDLRVPLHAAAPVSAVEAIVVGLA